jgi:serine acetyltransferase
VTLADPDRIDVRGTLTCGTDVTIDVGCVFEGDVRLGNGVAIGACCVLKNVTIDAGAQILPFCHFEDAIVGANSRIGPYARLRPGADLASDVHVGNFVEVKASSIGRGSKANHLAYIGDTAMGAGVNFGAGSITANYDGANKHRTIIDDDASIGSNCVLVAPIRIGRGATIGGGSTIFARGPADTLTVARPRQVSVPGWKRPVKKPKPRKADIMCGIVGASSARNIVPVLIDGIRRLEYRGYDSTGLAIIGNNCRSAAPRAAGEHGAGRRSRGAGRCAVAHRPHRHLAHALGDARRAHAANAHPHVSDGEIAVVHNGIIENYESLRERLKAAGYVFVTQTDTEVIAHLVHFALARDGWRRSRARGAGRRSPNSMAPTRSP